MSDFNSSLPVRTETNGDVAVKIVDGTVTSQALNVDANGKVIAKLNDGSGNAVTSQANGIQRALDVGINVAGVQIDPRQIRSLTAGDVVTANQGTSPWVTSVNNLPATADTNYGTVGASTLRSAAQIGNASGAADFNNGASGAQTLRVAANLAVAGANVSASNPIPVVFSADPSGDEINNYSTSAAVAAAASSNHDYTVTTGKTLLLKQIQASGSGKMKIEVQIESGVASNVFASRFVQFNSTANPNMHIELTCPISVAAGVRVRIIRTNKDNQSQDLYSTICGIEV